VDPSGESYVTLGAADPGFIADVRSAVQLMVSRPWLSVTSLLILSAPLLVPDAFNTLVAPVWFFAVGFPGTQRLWILRAFRGQPFTFDHAFKATWGYFGRFIRTQLLVTPVVAVGAGVGWLLESDIVGAFVGASVAAILIDFAITFVTPALAFTTKSAREALTLGLRMIRAEWPRTALYVLVPPMAILIIANLIPGVATVRRLRATLHAIQMGQRPPSIPETVRLISAGLAAVGVLLGLVFKGATVAFYARRVDVPPFGASSADKAPPVPPRPDVPG
jgi:hypothetical protein